METEIQQLNQHHPLVLKDLEEKDQVVCFRCKLNISGASYHCNHCCFDIHKLCVELQAENEIKHLPPEIKHSLHPQHLLTLLAKPPYSSRNCVCNACGRTSSGFTFNCSECEFDLDVNCAALKPIPNQQIQHLLPHPHPLVLCQGDNNFTVSCSGCNLPINDSIWVCLDCNLLLHKSCAELPQEIRHPFHPQHPLTLLRWPPADVRLGGSYLCNACLSFRSGLAYHCSTCNFKMELPCAQPVPVVKSEIHHHPLALVSVMADDFICNVCLCSFSVPFFRCVSCNFNLHLHCNPTLPHTIKHDCHLDPLFLTDSQIKDYSDDDENSEFYCDACEERRNLRDRTYSCAECHFVAHIHCVLSEIVQLLEKEWFIVQLDEKIAEHRAELKAQTTKLEDLRVSLKDQTGKVEELNAKIEALETKRMQLI